MSDIKLLKQSFNMCEVTHAPSFLSPYSFVISLPNKLMLICPTDEMPSNTLTVTATCSCFVLEREDQASAMKSTNALIEILSNAHIESNVMFIHYTSYVFVSSDDAMNTIMLLSKMGYDIKYSDYY